jgi:hypothetical protein
MTHGRRQLDVVFVVGRSVLNAEHEPAVVAIDQDGTDRSTEALSGQLAEPLSQNKPHERDVFEVLNVDMPHVREERRQDRGPDIDLLQARVRRMRANFVPLPRIGRERWGADARSVAIIEDCPEPGRATWTSLSNLPCLDCMV